MQHHLIDILSSNPKAQVMNIAMVAGIPVTQPKRFTKALVNLAQGKTDDWQALIWGEYVREEAGGETKKAKDLEKWKKEFLKTH